MKQLGQMLVERGLVSQEDLNEGLRRQANVEGWRGRKIGGILIVMGVIKGPETRRRVTEVLAEQTSGKENIDDAEHARNLSISINFPVHPSTPTR